MESDADRAREAHFMRMQNVLEESLTAIAAARTADEADAARRRAQTRLAELKRMAHGVLPAPEPA